MCRVQDTIVCRVDILVTLSTVAGFVEPGRKAVDEIWPTRP